MKRLLILAALCVTGCSRQPEPVSDNLPDFLHATYSVESLLSEAELSNPGYDAFDFIYLMATPAEWPGIDFDLPRDEIVALADSFDYTRAGGHMPLVPQMVRKAHDAGAKILLCFGGQKEFLPFLEKPERLRNFEAYMVRLVADNDFDGLDIDWEITLDKELHAGMMNRLRASLDSLADERDRTYYLTTALSIDHVYDRPLADSLSRAVDWINVMSYDMCDGIWGSTPSHNTSMAKLREKLAHWAPFDKRQLCLGLANYGFYYKGLKPGEKADGPLSRYGSYITYREFLPRVETGGWTEEYDPEAEVSYYFSPDREEFVTIENPVSMRRKIEWITANGFRGAFWWEFHHDYVAPTAEQPAGRHHLIDVVTAYLKEHAADAPKTEKDE
ncbi:glycoside hydrolase family 18 protein [uncultured Alistipes sp.]|uniref:glycoside hydrolase family 18 protein n=1 Tax=uncultured Alistipes sp. TaxID=538949 RepID=UPI00261E6C00|nr:glycoside hydrolase family 18 protein [uncultured Alistipes sp.]